MKESPATILARRIANRDTELHRRYDLFTACRNVLQRQVEAAQIELLGLEAGITQCHKRATEQGYPTLFTL